MRLESHRLRQRRLEVLEPLVRDDVLLAIDHRADRSSRRSELAGARRNEQLDQLGHRMLDVIGDGKGHGRERQSPRGGTPAGTSTDAPCRAPPLASRQNQVVHQSGSRSSSITAHGLFGPTTDPAVKAFQQSRAGLVCRCRRGRHLRTKDRGWRQGDAALPPHHRPRQRRPGHLAGPWSPMAT